ncbi:Hypothetical predicted protein [Octopus vulgaris]|uniref:PiggyBac transposable element-derived protein domain-containing protein n=1 Tax=Octopus vulgaris TaxID=6645 RepID=A0AA36AL95_OCTVU|nr:Hypothetical predicted protein [Octopus vulgaris]
MDRKPEILTKARKKNLSEETLAEFFMIFSEKPGIDVYVIWIACVIIRFRDYVFTATIAVTRVASSDAYRGYNQLPRRHIHWSHTSDTFNETISNAMRRDRFDAIMRYLHFSAADDINKSDKFAKLQPPHISFTKEIYGTFCSSTKYFTG